MEPILKKKNHLKPILKDLELVTWAEVDAPA